MSGGKRIAATLAAFCLVFAITAFIMWDVNPESWGIVGRYFSGVFSIVAGAFVYSQPGWERR